MKKYSFPIRLSLKTIVIFFLSTIPYLFSNNLYAQPNAVFVELLGNGGLGSINYERQVVKSIPLNTHIGAGILGTSSYLTIPISFQYLIKIKNFALKHAFLEIGLGATYTKADMHLYAIIETRPDSKNPYSEWNFIPSIGIRPYINKNYFFRLMATPVINYIGFLPYVGLSFGRSFNTKK